MATTAMAGAEQKLHEFLTTLSESRQAALPESVRNTYVRQLRGYDIRHVAKAISQMITEPREAFQPAFPDLGSVIRRVEAVRDEQRHRPQHTACGKCFSGYRIFNYDDGMPHHRVRDHGKDTYAVKCECLTAVQTPVDHKMTAAGE